MRSLRYGEKWVGEEWKCGLDNDDIGENAQIDPSDVALRVVVFST